MLIDETFYQFTGVSKDDMRWLGYVVTRKHSNVVLLNLQEASLAFYF